MHRRYSHRLHIRNGIVADAGLTDRRQAAFRSKLLSRRHADQEAKAEQNRPLTENLIDSPKTTGHIEAMPRSSLKQQIVEAAVATFHRQGFNGSSVQDIAEAAAAPKGSFYNHFGSKEEIAIAALDRYWERVLAALALLEDGTQPPLERLRRYFDRLATLSDKEGYRRGCLIGNMSTEMAGASEPIRERLRTLLSAWTERIEACIRAAQSDGSVRRDLEAPVIATFLLNAWEGAVLRSKVDRDASAMSAFAQAFKFLAS